MDKLLNHTTASVLDDLKSQLTEACANYKYDFTSSPTSDENMSDTIRSNVESVMKNAFGDGIAIRVTKSDDSDYVYHVDCSSSTNAQFIGYAIMNVIDEFRQMVEMELREKVSKITNDFSELTSSIVSELISTIFAMIHENYCRNAIYEVKESSDPLSFVDFRFGNAKTMYVGHIFRDLSVHVKAQ